MTDLFQAIPLSGNVDQDNNITAGPVGYTFTQADGAQIQNTGSMDNASSQGSANVVAGPSANAVGGGSTAVGQQALVFGGNSTGIGQGVVVIGGSSVVVGAQSNTQGSSDVVLGANASGGPGGNNIVIGRNSSSRPGGSFLSVTIGAFSTSGNVLSTVIGSTSFASGANDTIVGANSSTGSIANPSGGSNTIVGEGSTTGNTAHSDNTVVGQGSIANGGNCTAIGQGNNLTGGNCTAIGTLNTISGAASMAMGTSNTVTHNNSMVIGLGFTGVASIGNNQLLVSADGTQPPAVTGSGIIVHHASTNYTVLALSNNSSGGSVGGVFSISIKDTVECAIAASKVGAGTFTPINFYTSATKQLGLDTSGRLQFFANNSTGGLTVQLTNAPAFSAGEQAYTWVDCLAADGTVCVFPIFKRS